MAWTIRGASVGTKVALAPAIAILCLLAVGGMALFANARLSQSLVQLGEVQVPRIATAGQLNQQLAAMHALVNQSLAWEGAGFKADKIEALDKRIAELLKTYDATLKAAAADPSLAEGERQLLANASTEFAKYAKSASAALDIKTGMLGNAASFMTTMDGSYDGLKKALDELVAGQGRHARQAVDDGRALASGNQWSLLLGAGLALLATLAIATYMSRIIVRPLTDASRVANAVAQGDLSVRPVEQATPDATGQVLAALGTMQNNLSQIVHNIRESAEQVNQASAEIASGNADLSARTENTAAALEQTAAAIEQLSATIRNSADNARQADTLARSASEVAREGGTVVNGVIATMDGINAQAKKIGEIIGVIDGIAFQTNILALNAAVEAARAGEQGRGFSVVASEVRTLAQRSSDAAREIRSLISSSVERIDGGVSEVQRAGQTMSRIVSAIERVSVTVEEISGAAAQQAEGIAQVSQVVTEMDRSTQQNAALVEQASAAAESMKSQARNLSRMLEHFHTA